MQDELEHKRSFLERTDALSRRLGVSLRALADHIGISQATLFANRAGKQPISEKTWRKLEEAEQNAGLSKGKGYPLTLREDSPAYGNRSRFSEQKSEQLSSAVEAAHILDAQLRRLFDVLPALAKRPPSHLSKVERQWLQDLANKQEQTEQALSNVVQFLQDGGESVPIANALVKLFEDISEKK